MTTTTDRTPVVNLKKNNVQDLIAAYEDELGDSTAILDRELLLEAEMFRQRHFQETTTHRGSGKTEWHETTPPTPKLELQSPEMTEKSGAEIVAAVYDDNDWAREAVPFPSTTEHVMTNPFKNATAEDLAEKIIMDHWRKFWNITN